MLGGDLVKLGTDLTSCGQLGNWNIQWKTVSCPPHNPSLIVCCQMLVHTLQNIISFHSKVVSSVCIAFGPNGYCQWQLIFFAAVRKTCPSSNNAQFSCNQKKSSLAYQLGTLSTFQGRVMIIYLWRNFQARVHEHHQCFISQFCDLANVVTSIGRFFLISRTSGPNFDIKFFLVGSLGEAWFFKFLTLCSSNYLSKIQKRSACLSKEPNPLFKIFVEGFGFDFNSSKRVVS